MKPEIASHSPLPDIHILPAFIDHGLSNDLFDTIETNMGCLYTPFRCQEHQFMS